MSKSSRSPIQLWSGTTVSKRASAASGAFLQRSSSTARGKSTRSTPGRIRRKKNKSKPTFKNCWRKSCRGGGLNELVQVYQVHRNDFVLISAHHGPTSDPTNAAGRP